MSVWYHYYIIIKKTRVPWSTIVEVLKNMGKKLCWSSLQNTWPTASSDFFSFFYDRKHFYQTITKVSVGISLCCLLNDLFRNMLEKKASEVDYYLNAILLDCNHCLFCDTILVVICVNSQIIEPRIESRENKKDTDGANLSEWPQGLNIKQAFWQGAGKKRKLCGFWEANCAGIVRDCAIV